MTALNESGLPVLGSKLLNSDETQEGTIIGYKDCTLSGCRGRCLGVRWPDGKLTWPCSRGCSVTHDGTWRIGFV